MHPLSVVNTIHNMQLHSPSCTLEMRKKARSKLSPVLQFWSIFWCWVLPTKRDKAFFNWFHIVDKYLPAPGLHGCQVAANNSYPVKRTMSTKIGGKFEKTVQTFKTHFMTFFLISIMCGQQYRSFNFEFVNLIPDFLFRSHVNTCCWFVLRGEISEMWDYQ